MYYIFSFATILGVVVFLMAVIMFGFKDKTKITISKIAVFVFALLLIGYDFGYYKMESNCSSGEIINFVRADNDTRNDYDIIVVYKDSKDKDKYNKCRISYNDYLELKPTKGDIMVEEVKTYTHILGSTYEKAEKQRIVKKS